MPEESPPSSRSPMLAVVGSVIAFAIITAGLIFFMADSSDEAIGPTSGVAVATTSQPATSQSQPGAVGADMAELATATVQIVQITNDGQAWCSGSGSIIDASGIILTNAHVVAASLECPADKLRIDITHRTDSPPKPTYLAEVAGFDPRLDLATVRIISDLDGNPVSPTDLPFIRLGDSEQVEVGDVVSAVGYPGIGGDTISVTNGIVSGFSREAGLDVTRAWIKTDATIAGGNSGGAAVDERGHLIGIPTQVGANASAVTVDCRNLADTNGDGLIDGNDTCVPIGGFINGLRPVNLAAAVIRAARNGAVDSSWRTPVVTEPPQASAFAEAFNVAFALGVDQADSPIDLVYWVPSRTIAMVPSSSETICAFWEYSGMADGALWAGIWLIDGEIDEASSLFELAWEGGDSGEWWACLSAPGGIGSHVVEYQFAVNDVVLNSDAIYTGDDHEPFSMIIENGSDTDICFIDETPTLAANWGQSDLWSSDPLYAGDSIEIPVTRGEWDVRLSDCSGEILATYLQLEVDGDFTVSYP